MEQTVFSNSASVRVILGTGGTIAGRSGDAADNVGYVAGEVGVGDLVSAVPPLLGMALESEQIAQIDSKDMGFAVWKALALRIAHHLSRDEVQGVVVTHGTDTIEETAWFLHTVLCPIKPVVLTCAMRPASALVPDGPQNLLDAVAVAGQADARGVLVVCAGQIHCAEHVAKVHSYRVDAFDSGDAGPLGCVEEGQIRWYLAPPRFPPSAAHLDGTWLRRLTQVDALPRVPLLVSHADADGLLVEALLVWGESNPSTLPKGIVVACTGNGTLHGALEAALKQAQSRGVRVVKATRCQRGRVIPGSVASIPEVSPLSPVKARLALSLELLQG